MPQLLISVPWLSLFVLFFYLLLVSRQYQSAFILGEGRVFVSVCEDRLVPEKICLQATWERDFMYFLPSQSAPFDPMNRHHSASS